MSPKKNNAKTKAKAKAKVRAKAKSAKAKAKPPAKETKPQLPSVNELGFLMMARNIRDEDRELFIEDPSEYIFSVYNLEMQVDIIVVENDEKTMNLALPFYRPRLNIDSK